ncbi:MAG: ATP-binding protein, partial [Candidatus Aenigmatarchaeota archaeon]
MELERGKSKEEKEQFALTNISSLAVGLVHEIRNPLNTLYLHLQMLEWKLSGIETREKEELLGIVAEIRREIKRLDEFLSEFLRFAKPPELKPVPKNIVEIVESILGFVEVELALKNIELEKIFPKHEVIVDVDEMQFKQAIYNLILNAIQAMEGGGKLSVSVEQINEEVKIIIKDTGCGIKEQDKPKLFTLFFST